MNDTVKTALAALIAFLYAVDAHACATCGLNSSFTPRMFLISLGFFALPMSMVGYIAWRLWRDQKRQ